MTMTYASLVHNGIEYEAIPASIARTDLGWEDHGIFTVQIMFEWGPSGQGMPGYSFGGKEPTDPRLGAYLAAVLRVAGVGRWEDLRGRRVYMLRDGHMIRGLANLDDPEGNLFVPADLFKEDPS